MPPDITAVSLTVTIYETVSSASNTSRGCDMGALDISERQARLGTDLSTSANLDVSTGRADTPFRVVRCVSTGAGV